MPTIIKLAQSRRSTFRRVIKGTEDMLVFVPNEPVAVSDKDLESIRKDLGTALVVCLPDANGIYRPDNDATERVKIGKPAEKKQPVKKKVEKLVPQDTSEKMTPDGS